MRIALLALLTIIGLSLAGFAAGIGNYSTEHNVDARGAPAPGHLKGERNGVREMNNALLFSPKEIQGCLLYTSPSPRDGATSRMPSSA